MKKLFLILLVFLSSLVKCTGLSENPNINPDQDKDKKQYTASFLSLFDTVTYVVGLSETKEAFEKTANELHDKLEVYHQLFDIYHTYEGINNIKVINDNAGIKEVLVDSIIIEFLLDCKEYYNLTNGKVNVAMGSVLSLWHDARSDAYDNPFEAKLPDENALIAAKEHINFDSIVIDEEKSTVYISDPLCKLDVGAIAKGWSVQKVALEYTEGLLISVGGNVVATGPKKVNTPWVVGIQMHNNPKEYLHTLNIMKGCVVTSGDYQRKYVVDGKQYHHIIDPDTLYPSNYWHAVTIICDDSGVADMLSTALFLLPLEEGKLLLKQFNAEAVWVDMEDKVFYSTGFQQYIKI
ncbi:MAG: FAD:protein FMN transferase [Acholeplasmatales bacterium]|nr:FAD:protein FMN transferase [Acholeplasmatales bacterium]